MEFWQKESWKKYMYSSRILCLYNVGKGIQKYCTLRVVLSSPVSVISVLDLFVTIKPGSPEQSTRASICCDEDGIFVSRVVPGNGSASANRPTCARKAWRRTHPSLSAQFDNKW